MQVLFSKKLTENDHKRLDRGQKWGIMGLIRHAEGETDVGRPRQTVVEYRSYELSSDFPLVMRDGEDWRISPVKSNRLHFHNCFEIGLCLSDRGFLCFGEEEHTFRAGDVLCVGRNVPHTIWSAPGVFSTWCFIHMDPDALLENRIVADPQQWTDLLSDCHVLLHTGEHLWAEHLIAEARRELHAQEPGYERCVQGLIQAFMIRLMRLSPMEPLLEVSGKHQLSLAPALNYIHAHYMEEFPLEQLAAVCHLSPTHFRRLFREQLGISPLQFLHQVRILRSSSLLRNLQIRISDIAVQVGYTSQSCYNRHFLELMGCTPSEWRNNPGAKPGQIRYTGWQRAETGEEIEAHNAEQRQESS